MAWTEFQLVVEEGPERGQVIVLESGEAVIGREQGVDIVIQAPAVSRRHACIRASTGAVTLQDLGSSNGTFINGQKLTGAPVTLKPGDHIRLGRTIVLLLQGPAPESMQATVIQQKEPAQSPISMPTLIGDALNLAAPTPPQLEITVAGQKPQVYTLDQPRYSLGRAGEPLGATRATTCASIRRWYRASMPRSSVWASATG
jgi:pSer/pThr/pTyr-binding forkhead associated (FHA) protein